MGELSSCREGASLAIAPFFSMWPFSKRKIEPDVVSAVVTSAGQMLSAKYEAEARVELKRAENEIARLEHEAKEAQLVREWRAAKREAQKEAGRRTVSKRYGAQGNRECFICQHPGVPFDNHQWDFHRSHGAQERGN